MESKNHKIREFIMIPIYKIVNDGLGLLLLCFVTFNTFGFVPDLGTVPTPGLDKITDSDFTITDRFANPAYNSLSSWEYRYKINEDSLSVAMIYAEGTFRPNIGPITVKSPSMDAEVVDPNSGKEYILTSLGNNYWPLLLNNFTITPNIRRIEAYALTENSKMASASYCSYENRYIDENTEFDYVGFCALGFSFVGPLKIANNGEMHSLKNIPSVVKLGKNVTLKSTDHLFNTEPIESINQVYCQLYSYSETPPKIETYNQITSSTYNTIPQAKLFKYPEWYTSQRSTLYVPAGSKEAYSADPEWGRFENIVEMEPVALEEIIADEQQGISISTDLGQIYVSSTVDREVSVYAMSGLLLKRDHTRDGGEASNCSPAHIW